MNARTVANRRVVALDGNAGLPTEVLGRFAPPSSKCPTWTSMSCWTPEYWNSPMCGRPSSVGSSVPIHN
ncbi:MAG: hypothetical protein QOE52_3550 [Mycobacterium sp.]|jgi:hypothetical protein|nr:hypothetical protein [Mycobacterium sp.]MDT5254804.1 hypothetical protein [Mycobacterium sp.]MDT5344366.1 hypothetical protein [Mycobacterium sp.]